MAINFRSELLMTNTSLVLFGLLADRKRQLGALCFYLDPSCGPIADAVPVSDMAPMFFDPSLSTLSAAIPCFFSADSLLPSYQSLLISSGCLPFPSDACVNASEHFPEVLLTASHWVSGNWYLAPLAKSSDGQTVSRALALKLVQLVAVDADTHELEDVFRQDPALSYHLLRLVNSPGIGTGKKVSSFAQAILLLGRQQLRRWINLMLFASRQKDPRAPMLLARAAARARSMELLARAIGEDKPGQERAFMVGMFSLLGVLFGLPLEDVMGPLQMGEAINAAVLRCEGDYGRLLAIAFAAEAGNFTELRRMLEGLQVSVEDFNRINLEAHIWMIGVAHETQGGSSV